VANSLFAEYMIPKVYEIACNECKGVSERGVALLDYIKARLEAVPADWKVLYILKEEPFLQSQATDLIKSD